MSLPASTSGGTRATRMRGASISSPKFPLPEDAFAAARLSAAQLARHTQQIDALVARALDECDRADALGRAAYASPWELVGAQDGVTALRRKDSAGSSSYRLVGDVRADYRDIMELHYAESSRELFESLQFMYHSTLDAQVLQTLETASHDNAHRYLGVKWAVFQLSVFATKVHQCFLESMTYTTDRRGREVGVRVTLPLRLPEIDHTMDALKVRRMSSQTVQIVRASGDNTARVFVQIENDFALAAPAAYAKTLLATSQNLATCVDARRIRRRGLVPEKDWVANGARRSCVVCTKTFGATRGRHHCRLCGDVICRKCMLVRATAEPVTDKTFKVNSTKFCVVCIANLRQGEDLSASRVVASGKVREMAFAPVGLDESARVSVFSETESEGCRADFDFTDSARSSLSSYSEDQDGEKRSFGKRLEEIAERIEDAVIEEGATTTNQKPTEMVLFVPDETTDTAEFMMTIDTKDMAREPHHYHHFEPEPTPLSSSGVFDGDFSASSPERRRSSNPLMSSTRSIDQCLAEQEALLRQMVMATHGVPTPRHHHSDPSTYEYHA